MFTRILGRIFAISGLPIFLPIKWHDTKLLCDEFNNSEKLILSGISGRDDDTTYHFANVNVKAEMTVINMLASSSPIGMLFDRTFGPSPLYFKTQLRWLQSTQMLARLDNEKIKINRVEQEKNEFVTKADETIKRIKEKQCFNIVDTHCDPFYSIICY